MNIGLTELKLRIRFWIVRLKIDSLFFHSNTIKNFHIHVHAIYSDIIRDFLQYLSDTVKAKVMLSG